jgi:hypothetical protein
MFIVYKNGRQRSTRANILLNVDSHCDNKFPIAGIVFCVNATLIRHPQCDLNLFEMYEDNVVTPEFMLNFCNISYFLWLDQKLEVINRHKIL